MTHQKRAADLVKISGELSKREALDLARRDWSNAVAKRVALARVKAAQAEVDGIIQAFASARPAHPETAAALEARGVRMVDAPVSGAVEGAQAAELVFMVGGNDDDVADARDVLKPMGERSRRPGDGHPVWQEGVLAGAFLLLLALGVATVVLPARN